MTARGPRLDWLARQWAENGPAVVGSAIAFCVWVLIINSQPAEDALTELGGILSIVLLGLAVASLFVAFRSASLQLASQRVPAALAIPGAGLAALAFYPGWPSLAVMAGFTLTMMGKRPVFAVLAPMLALAVFAMVTTRPWTWGEERLLIAWIAVVLVAIVLLVVSALVRHATDVGLAAAGLLLLLLAVPLGAESDGDLAYVSAWVWFLQGIPLVVVGIITKRARIAVVGVLCLVAVPVMFPALLV